MNGEVTTATHDQNGEPVGSRFPAAYVAFSFGMVTFSVLSSGKVTRRPRGEMQVEVAGGSTEVYVLKKMAARPPGRSMTDELTARPST
jgi:hypothetical protein